MQATTTYFRSCMLAEMTTVCGPCTDLLIAPPASVPKLLFFSYIFVNTLPSMI